MHLSTLRDSSLPPLAWCIKVTKRRREVRLVCGPSVEVSGEALFFEGAWAGPFNKMGLAEATAVFGSGGMLGDDGLVLIPPTHTSERIQYLRREGELLASNSLAFLLAASGEELDPSHWSYPTDLGRIVDGIAHPPPPVPTRAGRTIALLYHHRLLVREDLTIKESPVTERAPGDTYESYIGVLVNSIGEVVANANDQRRDSSYTPVTSVSSGYDSPACAVLAKTAAGCRRALTFVDSRRARTSSGDTDSGSVIGRLLGMEVREFRRSDYLRDGSTPEAEFLATGMTGEDVVFRALEEPLHRTIFFTGFHGDKIWEKNIAPNQYLKRGDLSGASLNEFRLRVDFVHVPVPFISGLHHAAIHKISQSAEMEPYSVGGTYDRPIPRRLVEEAGVPRESFGMSKKAITSLTHTYALDEFSPATSSELLHYAARGRSLVLVRTLYGSEMLAQHVLRHGLRVLRKMPALRLFPALGRRRDGLFSYSRTGQMAFLWALDKIRPRYRLPASKLHQRMSTEPAAGEES